MPSPDEDREYKPLVALGYPVPRVPDVESVYKMKWRAMKNVRADLKRAMKDNPAFWCIVQREKKKEHVENDTAGIH